MWVNDLQQKGSRWRLGNWTWDANECEFTPDMAIFSENGLTLRIEKKSGNMGNVSSKPYWGAEYYSDDEYLYGLFVVKMKPSAPPGVVTSFFLSYADWNEDFTQADDWNEIDIEFVGRTDDVQFTLHWMEDGINKSDHEVVWLNNDASEDFAEWAIEWTPDYIKYYLEGELLHTFDDPDLISFQRFPQKIQLNSWISNSVIWAGQFDDASLPVESIYDYIAYYKIDDGVSSTMAKQADPVVAYPNPFVDEVRISGMAWENSNFKMFDPLGKIVEEGKLEGDLLVTRNSLERGVYVVELFKEGKFSKLRLVK